VNGNFLYHGKLFFCYQLFQEQKQIMPKIAIILYIYLSTLLNASVWKVLNTGADLSKMQDNSSNGAI
jgi:hypothetical protein